MMRSKPSILLLLTFFLFQIVSADSDDWDAYKCNSTVSCPKSRPCCSQYGICGVGSYCLGGCDVRYSYNLDACMPMPAMEKYSAVFDSTKLFMKQTEYLGNSSETDWVYTGYIDTSDDALLIQMPNGTTGTVVSSTKYTWYANITARIKSSRDDGVVTAFILYSDVQDELDHEFVGYDLTHPQSNYYSHGILNYNHAENTSVTNTFKNYHDYTFDWTEDEITWYIDDKKIRTLKKEDTWNSTTKRYDYPQTPSRIQFSLWPGGDTSNGVGTIEWAGGQINWDSQDIQDYGYYYAFIKEITVIPHDLPSDIEEVESEDGGDDFNAYLYNSTDADENNIYLTNKKTWLGNDEATGLDPDNEDDDEDDSKTETVVETSGSQVHTKTTTKTKSKSTVSASLPTAKATTSTSNYNPSAGIGGFVQDSDATSSSSTTSSGSGASTSSNTLGGLVGFFVTVGFGFFWI